MSNHMWIVERKNPMTDQKWILHCECSTFEDALRCVPSTYSCVLNHVGFRYYSNILAMLVLEDQEVFAFRIKKLY